MINDIRAALPVLRLRLIKPLVLVYPRLGTSALSAIVPGLSMTALAGCGRSSELARHRASIRFQFGNRRPGGVCNGHLVAERRSLVIIEQATKRGNGISRVELLKPVNR
jgi:hypothetical protein